MPNGQNNPGNAFVKKAAPKDRNRLLIEPSQDAPSKTMPAPEGRFKDRIKFSPMNEKGAATKQAIQGWPEGLKKT